MESKSKKGFFCFRGSSVSQQHCTLLVQDPLWLWMELGSRLSICLSRSNGTTGRFEPPFWNDTVDSAEFWRGPLEQRFNKTLMTFYDIDWHIGILIIANPFVYPTLF